MLYVQSSSEFRDTEYQTILAWDLIRSGVEQVILEILRVMHLLQDTLTRSYLEKCIFFSDACSFCKCICEIGGKDGNVSAKYAFWIPLKFCLTFCFEHFVSKRGNK